MSNTITVGFCLNKGVMPSKADLESLPETKKTTEGLRSCMSFSPEMVELEHLTDRFEILHSGLTPGSIGPGLLLNEDGIVGYPTPVVRFFLNAECDQEDFLRDVRESAYRLELPEEAFFFEDYNGFSEVINTEHWADRITDHLFPKFGELEDKQRLVLDGQGKWKAQCAVEEVTDETSVTYSRVITIQANEIVFKIHIEYYTKEGFDGGMGDDFLFKYDDCEYLEEAPFIAELYHDLPLGN